MKQRSRQNIESIIAFIYTDINGIYLVLFGPVARGLKENGIAIDVAIPFSVCAMGAL